MTRFAVASVVVGALFACAGTVQAASVYTSAWFFGDSLSDPGNLYAATGNTIPPSPPYFEGRRSNGRVWAEHVADGFEAQGLATANFAFAGANAVENDDMTGEAPLPFQIPDLPDQLASFGSAPRDLGKRPVGMLWFGANDVINAIGPASTPESVAAAAAGAAGAVADGITTLRGLGVRDVVVLNLPSLDQTPLFTIEAPQAAPLAGLGSTVFNDTLDELIGGMKGKRRIKQIDINATFEDLIENPHKYGVADATTPCIIPGVSVCGPEEADLLAFYDLLHPNRIIHGEIAGLVGAEAAPVPLPAPILLLLAGLGGIGLLARRRRVA